MSVRTKKNLKNGLAITVSIAGIARHCKTLRIGVIYPRSLLVKKFQISGSMMVRLNFVVPDVIAGDDEEAAFKAEYQVEMVLRRMFPFLEILDSEAYIDKEEEFKYV